MAGLNAAFEKVAKAAEKRLAAETKKQEAKLQAAGKKILATFLSFSAIASKLKAAAADAEKIAAELRLTVEEARHLRQGLDTGAGAAAGLAKAAPWAALAPPPVKPLILLMGALLGGAQGAGQDDIRRQMRELHDQVERERIAVQRVLAIFQRDVQRLETARSHTGRMG